MPLAAVEKIEQLVRAGATVIGPQTAAHDRADRLPAEPAATKGDCRRTVGTGGPGKRCVAGGRVWPWFNVPSARGALLTA